MNQSRNRSHQMAHIEDKTEKALPPNNEGLRGLSRDSMTSLPMIALPEMRLAELEELVLLAITGLGERAYGKTIRECLHRVGRATSVASIYMTLGRLESKELIIVWQGQPTAQRGGRTKKFYTLTPVGQGALAESERVRSRLRAAVANAEVDDIAPHGVADCEEGPFESTREAVVTRPVQSEGPVQSKMQIGQPLSGIRKPAGEKRPVAASPPPPRPDFLDYYGRW